MESEPYPDEAVVEVKPEQRRIGRGILVDGLGDDPADDRLGVRARVLVEPDPELTSSVAVAVAMGGWRSSQQQQQGKHEEESGRRKNRSRCHGSVAQYHKRRRRLLLLLPPRPGRRSSAAVRTEESVASLCLPWFGGSSLALRT